MKSVGQELRTPIYEGRDLKPWLVLGVTSTLPPTHREYKSLPFSGPLGPHLENNGAGLEGHISED